VIAQRTVGIERLILGYALAVAIVESGHLIFSFIVAAALSHKKVGSLPARRSPLPPLHRLVRCQGER
jgi:hypothetical protein